MKLSVLVSNTYLVFNVCSFDFTSFFFVVVYSFLYGRKRLIFLGCFAVAGSLIFSFVVVLIFDVVLFVSSHDVIFLKQHHKKKGVWLNFFGGQTFFSKYSQIQLYLAKIYCSCMVERIASVLRDKIQQTSILNKI